MKKPIVIRHDDKIIISYNGKKLIQSASQYKGMTDDDIAQQYIKVRNVASHRA